MSDKTKEWMDHAYQRPAQRPEPAQTITTVNDPQSRTMASGLAVSMAAYEKRREPADLRDIERIAAQFHDVYQQEAKRQGDVRHKDAYADLPENIKEFDRVLARFVIGHFGWPRAGGSEDFREKAREIARQILMWPSDSIPEATDRIAAALADERERCVKIANKFHQGSDWPEGSRLIDDITAAISSQKG